MVAGSTISSWLYTLDTTNGEADRVGTTDEFGIATSPSIHTVRGLGVFDGVLYLTFSYRLYTLDVTTGLATRVADSNRFAYTEATPHALAELDGVLYMVGHNERILLTINETSGGANRVGLSDRFGVNEYEPTGLAGLNGVLYMVGQGNEVLYTLDLTTGDATQVGSIVGFGVGETSPSGLAALNGVLYMIGATNNALYTLNITTGRATQIGTADEFGVEEGGPTGLAALDGMLYMVGNHEDLLSKSLGTVGNRWVALFPDETVVAHEDDLTLYVGEGSDSIDMSYDDVFQGYVSDYVDDTGHTISVNDNLDVALYKTDETPLYAGSSESVYVDIEFENPGVG